MAVTGDPMADLVEDMAAEQKARVTYDNILRLSDDPDVNDVIRFLREREIVHFQRFGEAVQLLREKLDELQKYKALALAFARRIAAEKDGGGTDAGLQSERRGKRFADYRAEKLGLRGEKRTFVCRFVYHKHLRGNGGGGAEKPAGGGARPERQSRGARDRMRVRFAERPRGVFG